MARSRTRRQRPESSACSTSFSLTASLFALTYRKRGEENVVLAVPCESAALMWFFGAGPIFALLSVGVAALLDASGVGSATGWAFGIFAISMAMGSVASFFVLLGQGDSEFCWKHEAGALAISVVAALLFA